MLKQLMIEVVVIAILYKFVFTKYYSGNVAFMISVGLLVLTEAILRVAFRKKF